MSLTTPRGHEQVLVIDDEAFIVEIVEGFLKQLGYGVFSATSGAQALKMFLEKKDQIALVILDQSMPDIRGADLAVQLRSVREDIPIIMISGHGAEAMWRETKDLGINGYMSKPVRYDQLAFTVRKALDSTLEKMTAL